MRRPHTSFSRLTPLAAAAFFALASSLAAAGLAPARAQQPFTATVEMSPDFYTRNLADGPFSISITVEDLHHEGRVPYDYNRDGRPDAFIDSIGLAAFQFDIRFDPNVLDIVAVEPGPDIAGATVRSFQCLQDDQRPRVFTFGCYSSGGRAPGLQGDITLAVVNIQPVAGGSTFLELAGELAGPLSDDIPVDLKGGAVSIQGPPLANSQPTQPPVATPGAATPVSGHQPDSDGDTTPDPFDPDPGNPDVPDEPDLDGDGTPDSSDPDPADPNVPELTDTDRDGTPDEFDPAPDDPDVPAASVGGNTGNGSRDGTEGDSSARGGSDDDGSFARTLLVSLAALGGAAAALGFGLVAVRRWRMR